MRKNSTAYNVREFPAGAWVRVCTPFPHPCQGARCVVVTDNGKGQVTVRMSVDNWPFPQTFALPRTWITASVPPKVARQEGDQARQREDEQDEPQPYPAPAPAPRRPVYRRPSPSLLG